MGKRHTSPKLETRENTRGCLLSNTGWLRTGTLERERRMKTTRGGRGERKEREGEMRHVG